MKHLRVIFVSLIAVGVCGGVYIGLTVGLAAYMSFKTGGVAQAVIETPTAAPVADPPTAAAPPAPAPPAMEDAASVLRRTWTAYRPGLSAPAGVSSSSPIEGRQRILPAELTPWLPMPGAEPRGRHRIVTGPYVATPRPAAERLPSPVEMTLAPPEAVVFFTVPPVRVTAPESARLRLVTIGVDRTGERPAVDSDVTLRPGEALLAARIAPQRSTPAIAEEVVIPNPTPHDLGPVRTPLADEPLPPVYSNLPESLRLPVN